MLYIIILAKQKHYCTRLIPIKYCKIMKNINRAYIIYLRVPIKYVKDNLPTFIYYYQRLKTVCILARNCVYFHDYRVKLYLVVLPYYITYLSSRRYKRRFWKITLASILGCTMTIYGI